MILVVSATTGNNLNLAKKLNEELQSQGAETQLIDLESFELPVYTPTGEKNGIPPKAKEITDLFSKASGYVFCAPEYNGSLPPILNNAIAWISRSGDENWRAAFNDKVAVVGTHSGSGGVHVTNAMRSQLQYLGCHVLARPVITHYKKELNPESAKTIMGQLIKYSK